MEHACQLVHGLLRRLGARGAADGAWAYGQTAANVPTWLTTNFGTITAATLTADRSAYVWSGAVSGTVAELANFNLTLSGFANGAQTTTLSGTGTGGLVIGGNELVIIPYNGSIVISAGIASGAGHLTLAPMGNGNVTLSGSNAHSGGTSLHRNTLNINNANALGTGTFTIAAGSIDNSSAAALTLATNNAQVWNSDFTFVGTQNLGMGTGTVSLGSYAGATRTITVTANTLTIGGGIIDGTHADLPTKNLSVSGSALGRLVLSGSNSYSGVTTVSSGILQFGTRRAVYGGDTSQWTAANLTTGSGGVMALDVGTTGEFTASDLDTFKALGTDTSGFLPGSFLGIDATSVASGTFTYSSNIANTNGGSNAFGIAKVGAGTLVLSGNNTMTGGVSVRGGTLLLTAANQIGTGPIGILSGTLSTSSDAFLNGTASPLTFGGGALQVTGTSLTSLAAGRTTTFTAGSPVTFDITAAANTFTVSQPISTGAAGSLTKLGAGTLVMTASSNYTGSTVIGSAGGPTGGTLRLSGAGWISGTSGTAAPLIYSGTLDTNGASLTAATLTLGGGAAATTAGVMTGSGTLALGGNVTFDATNNPGGATIAGNLSLGGTNRTFTVGDSTAATNDLTISAAITSGTLTKAGAGTLVLSGTNTFSGTTAVMAGILVATSTFALPGWDTGRYAVTGAGSVLALGSGFSNASVATVLSGGTFAPNTSIGFDTSGGDRDYNTAIGNFIAGSSTNARGLMKLGSGTLTLSAANTYTGTTAVTEGTLRVGAANALSPTSPLVLTGNASLDVANATTTGTLTMSGTGSMVGTATLTGSAYVFNGVSGTVILGGTAATLTKSNAGTATLSGLSTYGGKTTVSGGVLEFTSIANSGTANVSAMGAPTLANATIDLASGATLRYTGTGGHSTDRAINLSSTTGTATIEAAGSGPVTLGAVTAAASGTVTLELRGTSTAGDTLAGVIANPSGGITSLVKSGTGSWTLSGNNSHSGQTSITQGTLVAASNAALGVSPPTTLVGGTDAGLAGTAALLLGGTTSLNQTLQVTAAGSGATQTVILGGVNTSGTTSFGSAIVRVARDVTLQAATNGAVRFSSNWTGASGSGSLTDRSFTFGSAGNTGTVIVSSSIVTTSGSMTVAAGVLRLANQIVRPGTGQQFMIGSAGELAGTGTVAAVLAGAGSVGPGNSPGILLANGVDPAGGLDFDFEFTDFAPVYSSPTASVNDILRLTGTAPFTQNLTAANSIDIYFPAAVLTTATSPAQTYRGGFFTDSTAAQFAGFQSAISGASFAYYVSDPSGTISYKGNPYSLLPGTILVTPTTTTVASAGFSGGTVTNGQIMTFVVVPEPGALALAAIGIAAAAHALRRRGRLP